MKTWKLLAIGLSLAMIAAACAQSTETADTALATATDALAAANAESGASAAASEAMSAAQAANIAAEAAMRAAEAASAEANVANAEAAIAKAAAAGNAEDLAQAQRDLEAAQRELDVAKSAAAEAEAAAAEAEAAAAEAEAAADAATARAQEAEQASQELAGQLEAIEAEIATGGPSDAPGGPFLLTVDGKDYTMPGPAGGILGALPADEVFPWVYNTDTSTFEAQGDEPAATFDPSIRTASQNWRLGWVSGWAALEFSTYIEESINSTAEASGVSVVGTCDSEFDPEKALACAETISELSPDAVVFGNWRSEAAESSMRVFDEAGIPIITIDVWHPNAIFFGANNYISGAIAGVNTGIYALETWNCEGVHMLLAENLTAGEAPDLRISGFADGVQAVCGADVPSHRVPTDGSPEDGLLITTDWLTANPQAEHVVATSLDDVVAVPMSRAMEQAGRSGVAAGHGSEPNGVERMYEGPPEQTRYIGSVAYFPEIYGVYSVAALIDVLEGRPVPQEIHIDHIWVNRDNVDQYYDTDGLPIHDLGP